MTDERRTAAVDTAPKPRMGSRLTSGILGTFCALCLIALVGLSAMVAFTLVPSLFGWRPDVILTGSMEPGIRPGDVVISSPAQINQIGEGRVLLVKDPVHPSELLMHRVVRINGDGTMAMRGDANEDEDAIPVKIADVVGIPRIRVPMIGLPSLWVRDQDWVRVGVGSAVLLVMLWGASGVRRRPDRAPASSRGKSRGKRARGSHSSPTGGQPKSTTAPNQ